MPAATGTGLVEDEGVDLSEVFDGGRIPEKHALGRTFAG